MKAGEAKIPEEESMVFQCGYPVVESRQYSLPSSEVKKTSPFTTIGEESMAPPVLYIHFTDPDAASKQYKLQSGIPTYTNPESMAGELQTNSAAALVLQVQITEPVAMFRANMSPFDWATINLPSATAGEEVISEVPL